MATRNVTVKATSQPTDGLLLTGDVVVAIDNQYVIVALQNDVIQFQAEGFTDLTNATGLSFTQAPTITSLNATDTAQLTNSTICTITHNSTGQVNFSLHTNAPGALIFDPSILTDNP